MKNCENCENCILDDYGYSNYSTEGTYVYCTLKLHPEDGFDRFYGEDEKLKFADKCPSYTEGEAIFMDVDRKNIAELSDKQKKKWDEWCKT